MFLLFSCLPLHSLLSTEAENDTKINLKHCETSAGAALQTSATHITTWDALNVSFMLSNSVTVQRSALDYRLPESCAKVGLWQSDLNASFKNQTRKSNSLQGLSAPAGRMQGCNLVFVWVPHPTLCETLCTMLDETCLSCMSHQTSTSSSFALLLFGSIRPHPSIPAGCLVRTQHKDSWSHMTKTSGAAALHVQAFRVNHAVRDGLELLCLPLYKIRTRQIKRRAMRCCTGYFKNLRYFWACGHWGYLSFSYCSRHRLKPEIHQEYSVVCWLCFSTHTLLVQSSNPNDWQAAGVAGLRSSHTSHCGSG